MASAPSRMVPTVAVRGALLLQREIRLRPTCARFDWGPWTGGSHHADRTHGINLPGALVRMRAAPTPCVDWGKEARISQTKSCSSFALVRATLAPDLHGLRSLLP
jgi:hypothetical protein